MGRTAQLSIALLVLIAGCWQEPNASTVVGRFFANHGIGLDCLDVRKDGTYSHVFQRGQQTPIVESGRWSFEELPDGGKAIVFTDFTPRWEEEGDTTPGHWPARTSVSWLGHVELLINDDLGYNYVQRNSPCRPGGG